MGREGLRGDGRRQVGRSPQRLEVELAIAGIHATVMVDIRCRIEGRVAGDGAHRQVDRLAVETVHHTVLRHIAGHGEMDPVGARGGASHFQHLQPGLRDAEHRVGAAGLGPRDHRRQAGNLRNLRLGVGPFHDHAEVQGSTRAGRDFTWTHHEAQVVRSSGRKRAVVRLVQVFQCATEIRGQGLQGRLRAISNNTAARPTHHTEQVRIIQRISVVGGSLLGEPAHTGQVAVVVQVDIGVAIGRNHLGNSSLAIRHGTDRGAIGREDAAVGDRQPHAVGVHDLAHALRRANAVHGAIGRGKHKRRFAEFGGGRVVRSRAIEVVEPVAGAYELDGVEPELPIDPCIGSEGRGVVGQPGHPVFGGVEGIGDAPAIGQGEHHTRAGAERVVGAELLAAGGVHVGLQIHIAQLETPALAETAGDVAREGVVVPRERKHMPAQPGTEIDVGALVLSALVRRGNLDPGLDLGNATGVVDRRQAQAVEAIGQCGGIEAGQGARRNRNVTLRQHAEGIAALARDFKPPLVQVDVGH